MTINDLLDQLYTEPDLEKRRYIPDKLAKLGDWRSTKPLGELIIDKEQPLLMRNEAVESLGKQGDPLAIHYLQQVLNDADQDIRRTAVWSLGQIGTPETLNLIFSKTDDSWIETRRWVAKSAGRVRTPLVISPLIDYLNTMIVEPEERVLADIVRAFTSQMHYISGEIMSTLVSTFTDFLKRDLSRVVNQALMIFLVNAYAKGITPDAEFLRKLMESLPENDPLVRPQVILGLGYAKELEYLAELEDPITLTALGPAGEFMQLEKMLEESLNDTKLIAVLDGLSYTDNPPDLSSFYDHSNLTVVSKSLYLHAKARRDIKAIASMYKNGKLTYSMLDCLKYYGLEALSIFKNSALSQDKVERQTTVQSLISQEMQSSDEYHERIADILTKVATTDTIWHIRRDARIGLEQMTYKFE